MNLDKTVVELEWSKIDILLLNEQHKLAVIIENKLLTGEHDNQLDRYFQIVQRQYPGWRILALYLTIDGSQPTDSRYLPISYADIAEIAGALVISRETMLGPDVRTLMHHYVQMLRRNIVRDVELDKLCRLLYQKHKRAIDLIIARIPDRQQQIMEFCKSYLESSADLRVPYAGKAEVGFIPAEWDVPSLKYAPPSPYGIFQFYIRYYPRHGLVLYLSIRPGRQETRQKLYAMAKTHSEVFTVGNRKLTPEYCRVFTRRLSSLSDLLNVDIPILQSTISQQIQLFINNDLPRIQLLMKEMNWVWEENALYASDGEIAGGGDEEDENV